ncbi:MAG: hypothetical protein JNL09_00680 [Anaerolineales bacterium]|nr:hypothetical protein [Anaerolineales bacterium]
MKTHPIFQQHPLNGTAQISTGAVPTPYHIYSGYGAFMGGTADLAAVKQLLAPEQVQPFQTSGGRALMGIWVCDFTEASLGPHHELQFSIFVTRQPVTPATDYPLNLLTVMLTRPEVQMLCHGLWNNTETVAAYNRELLSLNARLTKSRIEKSAGQMAFNFAAADGAPIFSGQLAQPDRASFWATMALGQQVGFGRAQKMNQQPWVSMSVVNPLGVKLAHNGVAQAFTKNDVNAVRYFDAKRDAVKFAAGPYAALGFTPLFIQFMTGFKFVYLNPQ